MVSKKGQVAVFIIIALVIVSIIIVVFAFRANLFGTSVSPEFQPIYSLYQECITQETQNAASLISSQGGVIDTGEYVPGSEYAPFTSQLNFLGSAIPYWLHLSGNNIIEENIPTRSDMESEISSFIESQLNNCNFDEFYAQGFYVDLGEAQVETTILDEKIEVSVSANIASSKEDRTARKTLHEVEINSKLGKFHNMALELYQKQRDEAFLEEYAIDVMRLYAPVDGIEIQCTPKIWKSQEVVNEIYSGLESNIRQLKFQGDYYDLESQEDQYFVIDHPVDEAVTLLYSQDWPSRIEIYGDGVGQNLIVSEPVGNEQGMGIMGFCYVPYHFVYDLSFPVLFQINDGTEFFQFPVTVIIDGNLPRQAEFETLNLEREEPTFDICDFAESQVNVRTLDFNLNPLDAEVSYKCFDRFCPLGRTSSGELTALAPECVNGVLIAEADGYADSQILFSSNAESEADILLQREFEVEIEYKINQVIPSNVNAIVHFVSQDGKKVTALLPETKTITLSEGLYNITMHMYGNSDVTIPASKTVECIDVAAGGVAGFIGQTDEQCIEVEFPEVKIDNALIGGGKTSTYILESQLQEGKITIHASELPPATSLEQLQYNFEIFDSLGVNLEFT